MTPEQLTGLGALLLDLRDWLNETDPGCLDAAVIDRAVDVCAEARRRLIQAGAK